MPLGHAPHHTRGTTLTFHPDELVALVRYVSAGAVLLQTRHPVMSRLKGAMRRSGLVPPQGW